MYHSNLPAGAENDPNAPWNEPELCRYCDEEYLEDLAQEECKDSQDIDEFEQVYDKILAQVGLCKSCHLVECADDDY
jgi:hypothetical protein